MVGVGLRSKSWWHSSNSSRSLAFAPSRTSHAQLAQVRMQSPLPIPVGCLLSTPPNPLTLTSQTALGKATATSTLSPFSTQNMGHFFSALSDPCHVYLVPHRPSRRCPALCSSPGHSWTSLCPLPSPLQLLLTILALAKTTHHFCGILGAPPGGHEPVLLSVGPPGPDLRTWDPKRLKTVPGH